MIDVSKWFNEHYINRLIGHVADKEDKFYGYKFWYTDNEVVEFSKGNRDYIAGYYPKYSTCNLEEPIILSKYYFKKNVDNNTIIITDYDFDLIGDECWKKYTWVCNKNITGLQLIQVSKRPNQIFRPFWHIDQWIHRVFEWSGYYIKQLFDIYSKIFDKEQGE